MNKSRVAMTGLCMLLATSAAQAHLITVCVAAYASCTEASGAFDGVTLSHVTFTQAGGQSSAVHAVGTKSGAWQKANGKAVPYWSTSSGPVGQQPVMLSSATGNTRSIPVHTFSQVLGRQSVTPSSAAGNLRRIVIAGNDGHSIANSISGNVKATNVPEPETLALLMIGLLGVVATTRWRRRPAAKG